MQYIPHILIDVRILSVETSCDETSASIVEDGQHVLCNVIATSKHAFERSGGVIPEEAARKQVECILPVLHQAFAEAKVSWTDIDAIAVTRGPGLFGSLLVGTVTARTLASLHRKPLIGVHHTLGHLSSTWLSDPKSEVRNPKSFPVLTLSASGGHTDLWLRTSHTSGTLIGRTRDDAAGEAFDKGASLLGLPYPGGPSIAKAAEGGNPQAFEFPLPLKGDETLDFSFSGLKTALKYTIRDEISKLEIRNSSTSESRMCQNSTEQKVVHSDIGMVELRAYSDFACPPKPEGRRGGFRISDFAASYQDAICNHLLDRIRRAVDLHPAISEIHLVGGVSANLRLRELVTAALPGKAVRWPATLAYCTDNAAMIASAAAFMVQEHGDAAFGAFTTEASLPLANAVHDS